MSFGTLGSTSSAAADNAAKLLEMINAMHDVPQDFLANVKALLEQNVKDIAELKALRDEVTAAQQALAQKQAEIAAEQSALDTHKEQLRKLIG
jgi:hypothetical protein